MTGERTKPGREIATAPVGVLDHVRGATALPRWIIDGPAAD